MFSFSDKARIGGEFSLVVFSQASTNTGQKVEGDKRAISIWTMESRSSEEQSAGRSRK